MISPYQHLAEALANRPWAIRPEALQSLVMWLRAAEAAPSVTQAPAPPEAVTATARGQRAGGAVAVLPLRGISTQHPDLFTYIFGGTALDDFMGAFRRVIADETVKAVVLDIDSPGGSVFGVEEAAREILAARGRKPIIAVANSIAASAAYWIGSAADEFIVTPSGMVGSVGILWVHEDLTRMAESMGVTITLMAAGQFKTEGHPFEPLTEEARDHVQSQLDHYYGLFVATVAKGRGATVEAVRDGFGQGRMVVAKEAMKAGMVDRVATLEQAIAGLGGSAPAPRAAAADAAVMAEEGRARLSRLWDIFLGRSASGGVTARAVPSHGGRTVDDAGWDGDAAVRRLREWASRDGSGDKDEMNWSKYRQGFATVTGEEDQFGDYHYPHHDVDDDGIFVSRGGVIAAWQRARQQDDGDAQQHLRNHRQQLDLNDEEARTEGHEPQARIEGHEPRAEGRRNSTADQERIQTIHDLANEMGALCHDGRMDE